jgi:hypothetical protein
MPAMILMVVLLPAPFGPSSPLEGEGDPVEHLDEVVAEDDLVERDDGFRLLASERPL